MTRPDDSPPRSLRRREFVATGLAAGATLAFGPSFWRQALAAVPAIPGPGTYGPLGDPDANGLRLPEGFSSRLIARGDEPVEASGYVWHRASDGAVTFEGPQGGWVLVSNSELGEGRGGASAIRFSADGTILDANRILRNTSSNCAGGATPWGTCSPARRSIGDGSGSAIRSRAWSTAGSTRHPSYARRWASSSTRRSPSTRTTGRIYLTEDRTDGGLYRFTPSSWPDLSAGLLQIATVAGDGKVAWSEVPDPAATSRPTRYQVSDSTCFRRGEGIWFDAGKIYVATTDDNRIHVYDTAFRRIEVLYDAQAVGVDAPLQGVDNVTVSPAGDLFVCEDNGDSELDVAIVTPGGQGSSPEVARFLTATVPRHADSELTGVVFDPSGTRMYLSSQRALGGVGAVYEVSGPFHRPSTHLQMPTRHLRAHPICPPRRFGSSRRVGSSCRASFAGACLRLSSSPSRSPSRRR